VGGCTRSRIQLTSLKPAWFQPLNLQKWYPGFKPLLFTNATCVPLRPAWIDVNTLYCCHDCDMLPAPSLAPHYLRTLGAGPAVRVLQAGGSRYDGDACFGGEDTRGGGRCPELLCFREGSEGKEGTGGEGREGGVTPSCFVSREGSEGDGPRSPAAQKPCLLFVVRAAPAKTIRVFVSTSSYKTTSYVKSQQTVGSAHDIVEFAPTLPPPDVFCWLIRNNVCSNPPSPLRAPTLRRRHGVQPRGI
jgi:hypothetical protein